MLEPRRGSMVNYAASFLGGAAQGVAGLGTPRKRSVPSVVTEEAPLSAAECMAIGIQRLQQDPYWADADWELVDARKLPSPLAAYALERMQSGEARRHAEEQQNAREVETINADFAASDALQKRCDTASDESAAPATKRLLEREAEMSVQEWEFVSQHALAHEYLDLNRDQGKSFVKK